MKINLLLILISLIATIVLRIFSVKRRDLAAGYKIESGLWRVTFSAMICIGFVTLLAYWFQYNGIELPDLSRRTLWIIGAVLFMFSLRSVPGTFIGQSDFQGYRPEYALSSGITAIIPGFEKLIMVSIATDDFKMGDSDPKSGTKPFVITTNDSGLAASINEQLQPGKARDYLKNIQQKDPTPLDPKKVDEKGYNNIVIVATVITKTTNAKQFLLVNGKDIDEKDKNVESRLARIVAARARHYGACLTDDFFIREKDLIAEHILQDLNPGGTEYEAVRQLGQTVTGLKISYADFQDPAIKHAQAQAKIEMAQRNAEEIQATTVGKQARIVLNELDIKDPTPEQLKWAVEVIQAERGKSIRVTGDAASSTAAFGLLQGRAAKPPTT